MFDREEGALQTKVLDVQSKPNEMTQTVARFIHWTLCNNVFANLKDSVKDKLIGVCCPAHILNNFFNME